jgi:hypothetical protein
MARDGRLLKPSSACLRNALGDRIAGMTGSAAVDHRISTLKGTVAHTPLETGLTTRP